MSIDLRVATQRDAERWNKIVESDQRGTYFDTFEWNQALMLCSSRVKPTPLLVEENGSLIGVFPACLLKYRFSTGLESLPFSDYSVGTFLGTGDLSGNADLRSDFYRALTKFGMMNRCLRISLRRTRFPTLIEPDVVYRLVISDTNTCTFRISLKDGIEAAYRKIEKNRRGTIRQAQKRGIEVIEAQEIDDLRQYHGVLIKTMIRLGSDPFSHEFLDYIWKCYERKKAMIFVAKYEGKLVGGIILFIYKGTCHAWSMAVSEKYQDKRPTDLLMWHSIEWASLSSLDRFDLGSTKNVPSTGHYFWKKTWGGEKVDLYTHHIILQPKTYRLLMLINRFLGNR